MDKNGREICCHGYERPKTSHRYRYEVTPTCVQDVIRSMASIGLQTDTPAPKPLSRAKSTNAISQESPKENDFYQRCRSSSRQPEPIKEKRTYVGSPVFKSLPLQGFPLYRTGKMGSCWRHLRRVTGLNGENIMYIDGTVKESDCDYFPPHGFPVLKMAPNYYYSNRIQSQFDLRSKTPYHHHSPRIYPTSTSLEYQDSTNDSPTRQSNIPMPDKIDRYKKGDHTKHVHIHLQLCPHDLQRTG